MKTHLKAAIIGTGRIAGGLEKDSKREHPCTHAGMYKTHPSIQLNACAGRTLSQAREFCKQWKILKAYGCYQTMLKTEKIDILSICTPAPTHARMVIDAAKAGVRVIFCEKALATSLHEADQMIRACRRHKSILGVNYGRRFGWDYQSARQLLQSDSLGILEGATAWFSGNLMHTGTHMFDSLRFLLGEVRMVKGKLFRNRKPQQVTSGYNLKQSNSENYSDPDILGTLYFKKNLPIQIYGKGKEYFIFEMDITGSRGRMKLGNHLHELWLRGPSSHYSGFVDLQKEAFPRPPKETNPWIYISHELVQAATQGSPLSCTGQDARKAMEIGFALQLSSMQEEALVRLPLKKNQQVIRSK